MLKSTEKKRILTPSYAYVAFPCACGSMFNGISWNAKGLREGTETRRRFGKDGVEFEEG